jgi:hypothetical protein
MQKMGINTPSVSACELGTSGVLQRISVVALAALERQLQDDRLPDEERNFLAVRLNAYRNAAALTCGRPDCCMRR